MIRQLPIVPTIIVVAAAAVMVWLGIWQLGRAEEKAELIARYEAAIENTEKVEFPTEGNGQDVWFRRSEIHCLSRESDSSVAGRSARGAKGWAIRVECRRAGNTDQIVTVDLGFSDQIKQLVWTEEPVEGIIAPGPRLIADPPHAGLQPLAKPDPNDLPNNHLAYAGQWFFFALTALIIYWFAVKSRLAKRD